jgi:uncharacterized ferritin-like protein (DUF455 family)
MLRLLALQALSQNDVQAKLQAVAAMAQAAGIDGTGQVVIERGALPCEGVRVPGRPDRPALVDAAQLPKRPVTTVQGRAALLHSLAHIEFNAINLALDVIWRFAGMPDAFYADWLQVAREEALHFSLLQGHLQSLGCDYGDFPAHDGLWEMAQRTQDDLLARLALVPRTLEARGLDASPPIRDKLSKAGDWVAAGILDIILRDEIGHVRIGNHWYRFLCAQRGLDPVATYADLALRYKAPRLRGPFNWEARRAAGFDETELQMLGFDSRVC